MAKQPDPRGLPPDLDLWSRPPTWDEIVADPYGNSTPPGRVRFQLNEADRERWQQLVEQGQSPAVAEQMRLLSEARLDAVGREVVRQAEERVLRSLTENAFDHEAYEQMRDHLMGSMGVPRALIDGSGRPYSLSPMSSWREWPPAPWGPDWAGEFRRHTIPTPQEPPMDEAEWLRSADPHRMLRFLWNWTPPTGLAHPLRPTVTQHLCFALACCRSTGDERLVRYATENIGMYGRPDADGNFRMPVEHVDRWAGDWAMGWAAASTDDEWEMSHKSRASYLRDVLGNPWMPVVRQDFTGWTLGGPLVVPDSVFEWADATVPRLARSIRERRAWDDLLYLIDALLEAGLEETIERGCSTCEGQGLMPARGVDSHKPIVMGDRCEGCAGTGRVTVAHPLLDHLRGEVREHKDGATHYWYNTADPGRPHLTPERAKPVHVEGCWALEFLAGVG